MDIETLKELRELIRHDIDREPYISKDDKQEGYVIGLQSVSMLISVLIHQEKRKQITNKT